MSSQTVEASFRALCEGVNTPRSLCAWMLLRYNEHRQLAELPFSALDYLDCDIQKFRDDYLVTEYLSKYKGLETGIDTKLVALDSFAAAEDQCRRTNDRITAHFETGGNPFWITKVFALAQQKIEACIGPRPKFADFIDRFRWGKGSTFSLNGEDVRLDYKLCEEQISITQQALPFLRASMATDYAWLRARGIDADGPVSVLNTEFQVVRGSRGLTVPKNARTDRFIAAEPSGNIFLQLGVGSYLRQCLHRVGINLDDQSINQGLAMRGLADGLATVDLKAASDTISSAVVWHLLPLRWASFLDGLRSHQMLVADEWRHLSKFSSMGNGFTFELESLIFWALTEALRDALGVSGRVSVYGDDIICPTEMVPRLSELLDFCGFTFNVKKTHYQDQFRESCGSHFFGGYDVSPIYQKDCLGANAEDYYRHHNRLAYHAVDRGHDTGSHVLADRKLREAVKLARVDVPRYVGKKLTTVPGLRVPILSEGVRELEGGYVTDVRSLQPKGWTGKHYLCRALVFKPTNSEGIADALFAGLFRAREHGSQSGARWLLGISDSHVLTDVVNVRGHGCYRVRTRKYPEARELRWI